MIGWIWDPKNRYRSQHHLASNFKLSFQFHSIPKISYRFQHHFASIFNLSIRFHLIPKISYRLSNLVPRFNQSIQCGSGSKNLASAPLPKIRGSCLKNYGTDGTDSIPKLPYSVASKCPEFLNAEKSRALLFWQLEPDGTLIRGQIIWIHTQKLIYQSVFDPFKTAVNCGWTKDLNNGSTTQIFSFISVIILYNLLTGIVSRIKELQPRNYINAHALFYWNYWSFGD